MWRTYVEEVFEVYLVDLVVLSGAQVEFVCHFVGEEVGLRLCILEVHPECGEAADNGGAEYEDVAFHGLSFVVERFKTDGHVVV